MTAHRLLKGCAPASLLLAMLLCQVPAGKAHAGHAHAPSATTSASASTAAAVAPTAEAPPFSLLPLPYHVDALEPYIDAETMELHHGKHHKGYVDSLNKAVAQYPDLWVDITDLMDLVGTDAVPAEVADAVRNTGGGHYNHQLFWSLMAPASSNPSQGRPTGKLAEAIDAQWGSFDAFKAAFTAAGTSRFGSGWAWLVSVPGNASTLAITSTPNQDNPLMTAVVEPSVQGTPLLALDVWEHAYYLKHRNLRADYINTWWNVTNWDQAETYYQEVLEES